MPVTAAGHAAAMNATRRLVLADSIAEASPDMAGQVVVCGSHGGRSSARYVLALVDKPHAVLFNDAGVGRDEAGVVALGLMQDCGVIAATYAHTSARIGEAADGLARGVLSRLNDAARSAGLAVGQPVSEAVRSLLGQAPR